jgi:hypothetical protein
MESFTTRLKQRLWIVTFGAIEKRHWVAQRKKGVPLPLPRFLVIGAQKAGTTWLCCCLRTHPEVFLPTSKELHYFNANFHRNFRHYLAHFQGADRPVRGEMTPCYSAMTGARIASARRLLGPAKIIFLLRDPVARAKSYALMELCIDQSRRPEEIAVDEFIRHFTSKNSVRRTRYLDTYRRWSKAFGEENVWLDSYERIKQCPEQLLRDVCRFIGVDPDFAFDPAVVHEVVRDNAPFVFPQECDEFLEKMYAEEKRFFQQVTRQRLAR